MISVIDVSTNLEVASGSLPFFFQNAIFFSVGGELSIDGVLRYRAVNRVVVDNRPGQYYAPIGVSVVYDSGTDTVTATVQYPGSSNITPPTTDEIFTAVFPGSRTDQMIFAGFLELARRVGALDGQSPANLTAAQLINWFKNKVPAP